ncbi:MAG: (2Fe-2S)-binding protein [Tissierella sp.]|nr:(2Fe-2S)-binding protein [Tissierella sp.]
MIKFSGKTVLNLNINGENLDVVVKPSDTLLYTLRNELGLTGAKPGCENGDCGSCTVLIDDWPIKSCLMLTVEAKDKKITTIEGLKNAPIQKAFVENFAFQCGYCTSGFLMVCNSLALHKPKANNHTIQEWLQSNICRCTGYEEIQSAIKSIINNEI